jgi:hypothetical protein
MPVTETQAQDGSITLEDSVEVAAPPSDVYSKLILPSHQTKWNTLYLTAQLVSNAASGAPHADQATVSTGSIMQGDFKGSGKTTVVFADVVPGKRFTHVAPIVMFGVRLFDFTHRYSVDPLGDGQRTKFTQTVNLKSTGWMGWFLTSTVVGSLKKRMPESFAEFKAYAEKK